MPTGTASCSPTPWAQEPELVAEFIVEARDHLQFIEANAVGLERQGRDPEMLNALFRSFHSIKGLSAFLDAVPVREIAHEVETVLGRAREGTLAINAAVVDLLLAAADALRGHLDRLEAGTPPAAAEGALLRALQAAATGEPAENNQPEPASAPVASAPGSAVTDKGRTVKVDTGKLDHLVDMVGELVIAHSAAQHLASTTAGRGTPEDTTMRRLGQIAAEVQRAALAMRMGPVAGLFQRVARVVRDLARKTGKEVEVVISGETTELDRNLIEELADPLMHMVRNAVDHGVESAPERLAAGKPQSARISLRAMQQAGQVVMEIADDGRGLDRERILRKARERGLIEEDAVLPEAAAYNLIFAPGFSTAETITEVSGRGVGMDVVLRQVQRLRGRIDTRSEPGRGTTFTLRLPLTLATQDGLVVRVGGQRCVLPLHAVREVVIAAATAVTSLHGGGQVALVRQELLPVVNLGRRLGLDAAAASPLLVVVQVGDQRCCLGIDELVGHQEVLVKGLGPLLENSRSLTGGAVMSDGRVALVLDVEALLPHFRAVQAVEGWLEETG